MKKNSFVDFYSENNISPVSQDIENIDLHFQRRNSLFISLGIPALLVKDSKIIEFGPGSGHNALYTAFLEPACYYLVDGNKKGVQDTKKLLSQYSIPNLEVIFSLFLSYKTEEKFDIVWAEGCLPRQTDPIKLLKHLSSFTKVGGIFVVTTNNGISYLSEIIRILGSFMNLDKTSPLNEQLSLLRPFFREHLKYLKGMSRPVDDWILDQILQPVQGEKLLSIPDVIDSISNEFDFYGSSPKFVTDWRWYKDIIGEERNFNKIALDNYYKNNIHLLDCRFNYGPLSVNFGKELEKSCSKSWEIMNNIQNGESSQWQSFFNLLEEISNLIIQNSPETAKAITESSRWLQDGASLKNNLKFLPAWWGRGQQYISLLSKRDVL